MAENKYLFSSERLKFRKFDKNDNAIFYDLCSDPDVMHYFPAPLTKDQSDEFLRRLIKFDDDYGLTSWAAEEISTGHFIGFIGFLVVIMDTAIKGEIEIGWRLKKEFWGKGYATEGAKACIEYGFNNLGLNDIYAYTAVVNKSSQNIMKKLCMKYQYNFNRPGFENTWLEEHVLYKVSK